MSPATADATEATARASVFSFLARVLGAPPDADAVRGVRDLARELALVRPAKAPLAAVARDYMDLFVVPGPRYVAPYESVFRDEWPVPPGLGPAAVPQEGAARMRGLLMGDSTVGVRECFAEAGMRPDADLPDHVANELRLMAHLWALTAQGAAAGAAAPAALRERLRREHLQQWIGALAQRVVEREQTGFYGLAVAVAATFLEADDRARP